MNRVDHTVIETGVGQRLDVLVSGLCEDISRSAAARLIEQGDVLVSGRKMKKNYLLILGDIVEVNLPDPISATALPQQIPLNIVYEDDDLIVVNKEKGMVVHPGAGNPDSTLVNALLYHCGESLSGVGGVQRPGIVHRIDKDTSGLLVVAKNDFTHVALSEQLSSHNIRRCYHAIVKGIVKHEEGEINAAIARDKNNRLRMAINPSGREATTYYEVLQRYFRFSYLRLRLKTGRTHQIRVHMQSIGHPVAGDSVYGEKSNPKLNGQCLHAKSIEFIHPRTGAVMSFDTDLPEYFNDFIGKIDV